MATYKFSAKINTINSKGRAGGWTENWFRAEADLGISITNFRNLMLRRMALASSACTLVAFEYIDVAQPGISFMEQSGMAGTAGPGDTPWQALYFQATSVQGNKSKVVLPGMPDASIINGAYAPTFTFSTAAASFIAEVLFGQWSIHGIVLSNIPSPIRFVNADGTFQIENAIGLTPGARVQFYRTKDTNGKSVKGVYRLSAGSGTTGTLSNWPANRTVTRGKMRLYALDYQQIRGFKDMYITKRPIGRPFGGYVARRRRAS